MIALTVMIFFTSAVFTLLNDTSNSFQKSYDNFVKVGNLHDFTVKENFSVTGEVNYNVNDSVNNKDYYNMKLLPINNKKITSQDYTLNINNKNTNLLFKKTTTKDNTNPKILIDNSAGAISVTDEKSKTTTTINSSGSNAATFKNIINDLNTNSDDISNTKVVINMSWDKSKTTLSYLDYFNTLAQLGSDTTKAPFVVNVDSKIQASINRYLYTNSNQKTTLENSIKSSEQYNFIQKIKNSDTYSGLNLDQFNAININSSADNNYYKVVSVQNHYDVANTSGATNNKLPINNTDNWSAKTIDKLNVFSGSGLPAPDKYSVLKSNLLAQIMVKTPKLNKNTIAWDDHGSSVIANWGSTIPASNSIKSISATVANISPGFAKAHYKTALSSSLSDQLNQFLAEGQGNGKYDFTAYLTWLNNLPDQYKVKVDNTSFVIRGISLSPDFMYPVMDSKHLTPNPSNEALVYTDWRGYEGIHTAFRTNPIEKFLVGTFASGSSSAQKTKVLNWINTQARQVMNFPTNVKIASLNNDFKNSGIAAARIGFISTLVSAINHISLATIIFLIALTAFVSIIITSKYISSRKSSLGILKSLGYSNFKIASSLLVFSIIASSIGATTGYLLGLSLQNQMIGLFVNYWTIPTDTISFSWVSFTTMFVLPIIGLSLLTYLVAFIKLREKPTVLINPSSGFKINFIARHFTKIFNGFKATRKFKYSLAFSSITKLLTLSAIIGGTITTATFYLSNHNSFIDAQKNTQAEKAYKFSIDLETPTIEGGDYRAVPFKQLGFTPDPNDYKNNKNPLSTPYIQAALSTKANPSIKTDSIYGVNPNYQYMPTLNALTQPGKLGNLHFPTMLDGAGASGDPYYLEQHVQTKFGLRSYNSMVDAWQVAVSKMPPNQRNAMNHQYNQMISALKTDTTNNITYTDPNNKSNSKPVTSKVNVIADIFYDKNNNLKSLSSGKYSSWKDSGMGPSSPFLSLMTFGMKHYDSYRLDYGYVPLENNDETYTDINGPIYSINGSTNVSREDGKELGDQKVMGITDGSKFIKLLHHNSSINHLLFNNSSSTPLIVNQFAKKQYNLHVGDDISFKVKNDIYRFQRKIKDNPLWTHAGIVQKDYKNQKIANFQIVGINDSYQGSEFFTSQSLANKALGFQAMQSSLTNIKGTDYDVPTDRNNQFPIEDPRSPSYNHGIIKSDFSSANSINTFIADDEQGRNQKVHFNGIFSNNDTATYLSKSMNVYSPSGLYPAMDTFDPHDANAVTLLSNPKTINAFKGLNIIGNNNLKSNATNANNMITDFNNVYGKSIYLSAVINVDPKDASDFMFSNFTHIENKIEKIIFITMLIIATIITITASNMIIADNKYLISNLKILGFRNREISNMFLSIYIPAIFFGVLLAIPLVSWLIKIFNFTIFKNTSIYILSPLHWWYFAISLGAVGVIFGFTYLLAWRSLSKRKAIEILKEGGN